MFAWLIAVPRCILWIVDILRGYLGAKAEIEQKQEDRQGETLQQNADLRAIVARDEAAMNADANAPASKTEKLNALESGAE